MRNAAFIVFGFVLLVLQAAFGVLWPLGEWAPNLALPIVIYLGVTNDVHLVQGAILSFLLGYLLDSFSGAPMGLETFMMIASFLIVRGAGLNLFMRGPLLQILTTFVLAVIAGGSILALRGIFEPPAPFPLDTVTPTGISLVTGAITTALCAPLLFALIRRLDALVTRRRKETPA